MKRKARDEIYGENIYDRNEKGRGGQTKREEEEAKDCAETLSRGKERSGGNAGIGQRMRTVKIMHRKGG